MENEFIDQINIYKSINLFSFYNNNYLIFNFYY